MSEHHHCHHHDEKALQEKNAAIQASGQDINEVEHICPMHPEVRQIGPGDCGKQVYICNGMIVDKDYYETNCASTTFRSYPVNSFTVSNESAATTWSTETKYFEDADCNSQRFVEQSN